MRKSVGEAHRRTAPALALPGERELQVVLAVKGARPGGGRVLDPGAGRRAVKVHPAGAVTATHASSGRTIAWGRSGSRQRSRSTPIRSTRVGPGELVGGPRRSSLLTLLRRRSRRLQTDPEGIQKDRLDDQGASDRKPDGKASESDPEVPASAGGGFTCRRSAPPNSVSAAVRSRSPPGRRPATVRTLTAAMRDQPLTVLLHRLNWVLRSWTTYFRHGSSWATFDYLRAFTWRRVVCRLRRKHPRISWKELRRRYLPGCWWPTQGAVRMFNPAAVMIVRYPYRGAKIPTVDQRHAGITRMRSLIWTGGAPVARQRTAGSEARVGERTIAKHGAALRPDPYYDHRPLSGASASAWHQVADRPAHGRFVGAVGPPPVEDRAGLGWAGGGDYESATSALLRAVLRPGDAGLLDYLLQQPPAATMVAVSEVDSAEVLCSAGQYVSSPSAGWNGVSPKGDQVERRDKTVCPVGS